VTEFNIIRASLKVKVTSTLPFMFWR